LFGQAIDVVRALERIRDYYGPRSASLMVMGGNSDPHAEPFRSGFLGTFEERHEVVRRLMGLEERERSLLMLWHVVGTPVTDIARRLGMSRVHCYRVRARALASMLDEPAGRPAIAV
jgi:DNA-directed RNA polymerase specialized sigma24 family protein